MILKPIIYPEYDFLHELKNICIKIPLLQAIKIIPIYAKTNKELCLKKKRKKRKDSPIIQFDGKLASLMSTNIVLEKYVDPGVPLVTISINKFSIPNTLIDLGIAINVMTMENMHNLNIWNIQPTPTLLELENRSKIRP